MQLDAERRDFASNLRDTLRILRAQWWLVALCALVAAAAGFAWGHTRDATYESHARVLVVQPNAAAGLGAGQPFLDPTRERATDLQLVTSPVVARRVVRDLKLKHASPGQLLAGVTATANGDSNVIDIGYSAGKAGKTSAIVNAFADEFVAFRRATDTKRYAAAQATVRKRLAALRRGGVNGSEVTQLKTQARQLALLGSLQTGGAQVVQRAAGPGAESASDTRRLTIITALIGLLLGLALAFLRDRLDPVLRDEDAVRAAAPGVPILATIPRPGRRNRWIAGEGFHNLQVSVDSMSPHGRVASLLVTGTSPGEGKSTTAANLAAAMAGKRRNVAVFEADLRRPGLSRRFGLNGEPGVANVLQGKAVLQDIVGSATVTPSRARTGPELCLAGKFAFVPAGPVKGDPRALLDEAALVDLVDGVQQGTDTVIIDGPPISMFSDVVPLAQRVDGVVLAVRLHHTQRAALERLLDRLATASIRPMGIVVLGAENGGAGYGHYARD